MPAPRPLRRRLDTRCDLTRPRLIPPARPPAGVGGAGAPRAAGRGDHGARGAAGGRRLGRARGRDREDRQRRRARQPAGGRRPVHGRRLPVLRRRPADTARLRAGGRGRLPLRHRPARDHRRAVGGVPEHRRSGGPRSASPLRPGPGLVGVAGVRPGRLLLRCPQRRALLGGRSGVGGQAVRLRQLPGRRAVRRLALQRAPALQAHPQRRRLHLRDLPRPPLAADRAGDVRPRPARARGCDAGR